MSVLINTAYIEAQVIVAQPSQKQERQKLVAIQVFGGPYFTLTPAEWNEFLDAIFSYGEGKLRVRE